ncbi:DMT family transporter [Methanolobus psychrotolerans]|uniref:DMT family transporter n=1 Tax=Methanolobus psychrotolerans TaxID=1874706 RepID=UPI000B91BBF3|nr:DMT family transporter [Methanolobus psychrotolerans]
MIPAEFLVVFFGLISAASWGAGDFSGGFASKKANVYSVVLITQAVGVFLLAGSAYVLDEQMPSLSGMIWGGLAGIFISIALLALYKGLSLGKMGFVAPVSAVVAASVPVVYGAFYEGLPAIQQIIGFVIALIAVWLIAGNSEGIRIQKKDLYLPFAAGTGFGLFFVTIDHVSENAVLWPLTAARIAAVGVLLAFIILSGQVEMPSRSVLPVVLIAGVFDTGGNTFYALASQAGRLDIASITSSLYPAGTVLLAWLILKEKLAPRQWVGVICVLAAIILISL